MNLFPTYIENVVNEAIQEDENPKEYEIDFETGQLTGKIVEGIEAIKVWIWLTLQIPRYRYYIYSWDYGSEFEELIGQGYSEEHISSEVQHMTEECLLINDYIESLTDFTVSMDGDRTTISFTANTRYGTIKFDNQRVK